MWNTLADNLPHLNAALNIVASVLLAMGLWNIKQGRAKKHKKIMLNAFLVSIAFLACYLLHKFAMFQATGQWNKTFPSDAPQAARITYFSILIPHILLAIAVPFLAIRAIYLAKNGRIVAHKKWVRYAFPIWMYVSVTGVLVYLMLYQFYA